MFYQKTIAINSDDSASEEDCFSSTEDYTMVNQNTWTTVPEDEWIKTQSICTCVAIGCVGYKNGILQKALGHFGQKCKQVLTMAAEIASWEEVAISYVGGWNSDAKAIVAQFETARGPALQPADIVMSHVSPFDLPLNRPEGFTLGLVLDVDYFPDEREMSFSGSTWTFLAREYPHLDWDLRSVYENYAEGLIGETPIDLFLHGRSSQALFDADMADLNPVESDLVAHFYCLAMDAGETTSFVTRYQAYIAADPVAKRAKNT